MPGIQDPQVNPISTLGQPIAPTVTPAATPEVAGAMLNAFNQGRNQAVQDMTTIRNEPVVQAQRNLALEQAKEQLSPEAVQARQSAIQLAGAQAEMQRQTLYTSDLIKKHLQYNTPILGRDGKPDNDAMAQSGARISQAEARFAYAQAGLQRTYGEPYYVNGVQYRDIYNGLGDKILDGRTGQENTKAVEQYRQMRHDAFDEIHTQPKAPSNTPAAFRAVPEDGTPAPPSPADQALSGNVQVEPKISFLDWASQLPGRKPNPSTQDMTSFLLASKAFSPADVSSMNDQQLTDAYNSLSSHIPAIQPSVFPVIGTTPAVQPVTPPAAPAVSPAVVASNAAAAAIPNITGYTPGSSPKDIKDDLEKQEHYKNWAEKSAVINRFRSAAATYTGKPGEITTQKDAELATALTQLQAPGGGGSGGRGTPEFRSENIEESAPILESLYNIKGLALKEHKFTPETRARLIDAGNRAVDALETPARAAVNLAAQRLQRAQANPADWLDSYQRSLLNPVTTPAGAGGTKRVGQVKQLGGVTYTLWQ